MGQYGAEKSPLSERVGTWLGANRKAERSVVCGWSGARVQARVESVTASLLPDPDGIVRFGGLSLEQFWPVLDRPSPLAGMPYPAAFDWSAAAAAGFDVVVNLHEDPFRYDPTPLRCESFRLDDLYGNGEVVPNHPEVDQQEVLDASASVISHLQQGEGVIVHCAGGTGRTGTVIAASLIRLGYEPDVVVRWLNKLHQARGRRGWPESSWQVKVLAQIPTRG
jgi:Swiss Army Knife protein, DSP-PTPase phosphatase domain